LQKDPCWLKRLLTGDNISNVACQFSDGISLHDINEIFSQDEDFDEEYVFYGTGKIVDNIVIE
jgi:hypothetical protein